MISQTVEYALRAMSYLASLDPQADPAASSETIAGVTRVPQGYLSKVMRDLVKAELVRSFRGPRGGFSLARRPAAITLLDVVNAVDPITRIQQCPLDDPSDEGLCPLRRCLDDALAHMQDTLRRTTLGVVLQRVAASPGCPTLLPDSTPSPAKEVP